MIAKSKYTDEFMRVERFGEKYIRTDCEYYREYDDTEIELIGYKPYVTTLRDEYIGRAMQGLLSNPIIITEIIKGDALDHKYDVISEVAINQVDNILNKIGYGGKE